MHRRHFLRCALAGPALLAEAARNAAWARATFAAPGPAPPLFDIHKVAEGVYAAIARAGFAINCNAAIFVNQDGVMVVDTHSKPSAARALLAQIREITPRPVRYIVNTHFHWDHSQGNHAYLAPSAPAFPKPVEIISSEPTRRWLEKEGRPRIQSSRMQLPKQLEALRERLGKARDAAERARTKEWLAQGEAYLAELKTIELDLPTVTFDSRLVLHQGSREIHLLFLGRGHTAGDVVAWLPQEKVVATGDLAHGLLPYIADGYPAEWITTLDRLLEVGFERVIPGHGGVQQQKQRVTEFRNYLEELTGVVRRGLEAGRSLEELEKDITPASLRSLQADGFVEKVQIEVARLGPGFPTDTLPALEQAVRSNVADIYKRLKA